MARDVIPFNLANFQGEELTNIELALSRGNTAGNGPFGREAASVLSSMHAGSPVLLTPSCTSALELAARLVEFGDGDEIIVPSYTFVSTVSAFASNGATPVFCDVDPRTLGMDLVAARALITPRTRAICIVHYAGVPADPFGFAELAKEFGLVLIEDNAHGLGGGWEGQRLGTFGALSTLSFHETKNITCGEGGALVINDKNLLERAEILQQKGTNRTKFLNGQVDKYTWVDVGSSWVMSDILAGVLLAQLARFETIQSERMELWLELHCSLEDWAVAHGVKLASKSSNHTAHMFYLLFPDESERRLFIRHLELLGVKSVFHYQPLHSSRIGSRWVKPGQVFPVSEFVGSSLVRLPFHTRINAKQRQRVIDAVTAY